MVRKLDKLIALERIAQIKAERELKKFGAFRQHMTVAEQECEAMQNALQQSYDSPSPLTLAEARMANAQAGRSARELERAQQHVARMRPGFEKARQDAAREFGRAEVLLNLARQSDSRTRY